LLLVEYIITFELEPDWPIRIFTGVLEVEGVDTI